MPGLRIWYETAFQPNRSTSSRAANHSDVTLQ
jgi:hypothetical protein